MYVEVLPPAALNIREMRAQPVRGIFMRRIESRRGRGGGECAQAQADRRKTRWPLQQRFPQLLPRICLREDIFGETLGFRTTSNQLSHVHPQYGILFRRYRVIDSSAITNTSRLAT